MSAIEVMWDGLAPLASSLVRQQAAFQTVSRVLLLDKKTVQRIAARYYAQDGFFTLKLNINGINNAAFASNLTRYVVMDRENFYDSLPYISPKGGEISGLRHYILSETGLFLLPRLCEAHEIACPERHARAGKPSVLWETLYAAWIAVGKTIFQTTLGYSPDSLIVQSYRNMIQLVDPIKRPNLVNRSTERRSVIAYQISFVADVSVLEHKADITLILGGTKTDALARAMLSAIPELSNAMCAISKRLEGNE